MKNELLTSMSTDMGISRYRKEDDVSFTYRLVYSAMALWCLHTGIISKDDNSGISKNSQTRVLNELLEKFSTMFPSISNLFINSRNSGNSRNSQINFPVFIRNVYMETGYFLTDNDNRNRLSNYGRCIKIDDTALFFGLAHGDYIINGLGVFSDPSTYCINVNDFLVRDALTSEEYYQSKFDRIEFRPRDFDTEELEFFNPLSNRVPSQSWSKTQHTNTTVARREDFTFYYRVENKNNELLFADECYISEPDSFFYGEFRRLNFALKAHYGKPLKATIEQCDDYYFRIKIGGYLPNREYYFLLLISWPERNAFDKIHFIIRKNLLKVAIDILSNIGIQVEGQYPQK
jgi:hypothetical protein